jgi:hypothetical protein
MLEQDVENRLNSEGIPILKRDEKVFDALGDLKGDIDFEVPEAIIEVTVSPKGKLDQIEKYMTPLFNPTEKAVVLFAPKYGGLAGRDAEQAGAIVVKTLDDLIGLVK